MTTYTSIPNTDVDVDSPVTEELVTALRDNPLAIQEGDATAPKIAHQALRLQEFTSSGTFNVPAGVSTVLVEVIGGGGGGNRESRGGGAAGGYARGRVSVTPSGSVSVTVGSGGAAISSGSVANDGGSSSFGTSVTATGGGGGIAGTAAGGTGGGTAVDLFILTGSYGAAGVGGGGRGFAGTSGLAFNTGAGVSYGDGGGGVAGSGTSFAGKSGVVRVWY